MSDKILHTIEIGRNEKNTVAHKRAAHTRKGDMYSKAALVGVQQASAPSYCRQVHLSKIGSLCPITMSLPLQSHLPAVTKHKESISAGDFATLCSRSDTLSTAKATRLLAKVWTEQVYAIFSCLKRDHRDLDFFRMACKEADKTQHRVDSPERKKQKKYR